MLRRTGLALAALAVCVGAPLVATPASAAPAAPSCAVTWGSGTKTVYPTQVSELTGLRAGVHDCYDRLVFDVSGLADGYYVTYVDQMTEDPTGNPVPLRGGAKLSVSVNAPAYDSAGNPTYTFPNRAELVDVTGYQTFRQVAWAGSFEGTSTVGLGVRARLPFRVFSLGDRIVVDVAHSW
jgi:hypothetical protein